MDIQSNVVNLTEKVKSSVSIKSPSWLYEMHKSDKLFYDRERLQRLLNKWPENKTNSYIYTLLIGASLKDCFQLASIDKIVKTLKEQLVPNAENYDFIEENLVYFQELKDGKFEYLVLDGQHRIDTLVRYFDNEFHFTPPEPVRYQIVGEKGVTSIKGKFEKLDEEIQKYILARIPMMVVVYETGDLRELSQIFITSNSMKPMTKHEKRILNYNSTNRWLNYYAKDINLRTTLESIGSGMNGEYALDSKGDTLFLAEMLCYISNNYYDGYDHDVLDDVLGPYPSGKFRISETDKNTTWDIAKTMVDGCIGYDSKKLKKFTKSSLYNLFYTLSFIMQKGNVWGKEKNIDGSYKIIDKVQFVKWFFDEEFKRINAVGTKVEYKDPSGKTKYQIHDTSFAKHNADQKHSRKQSTKNVGGSKYSFVGWARVLYLREDLVSALNELEKRNIIAKKGTRTSMTRDEALVALDVPLSQSDDYHIDEIVPVSKGGSRKIGNIAALKKDVNLLKSDRSVRTK